MVLEELVPRVKTLIKQAARSGGTVPFSSLFACFPDKTRPADVYDTLEAGCAALASWSEAIYSVVLAKKLDGLPGDGFFDIFRIHRSEDFSRIAQGSSTLRLTQAQKEEMVALEKARVYEHAKWQP